MQFTPRKSIGGRAWLSISLETAEREKALVLWANTSLGFAAYWWHANKQQSGRGSIGRSPKSAFQRAKSRRRSALAFQNASLRIQASASATESHRSAVLKALNAKQCDVNSAIQKGVLIPLDINEALSRIMLTDSLDPPRLFDTAGELMDGAAKSAQRKQLARVGICRECPPSVCEGENLTQAVRLEQLWALIAHTCVVDLLCGYPTALFERHNKGVEHIREVHSAGLPCKLLGVFVDYTPRFVLCESGFS